MGAAATRRLVKPTETSAAEDEEKQFPAIWAELQHISETAQPLSPRLLLMFGLLECADAVKAGRFLACCPWVEPGGLADYVDSVVFLRPPLDTEAMTRAGTIIGAAWEPANRNGRASALLKQMIWLGSKASDGLSRWIQEKILAFVDASDFLYDSQDEDDEDY